MKSVAIATLITILVVVILAYIVINILVEIEMKQYKEEFTMADLNRVHAEKEHAIIDFINNTNEIYKNVSMNDNKQLLKDINSRELFTRILSDFKNIIFDVYNCDLSTTIIGMRFPEAHFGNHIYEYQQLTIKQINNMFRGQPETGIIHVKPVFQNKIYNKIGNDNVDKISTELLEALFIVNLYQLANSQGNKDFHSKETQGEKVISFLNGIGNKITGC